MPAKSPRLASVRPSIAVLVGGAGLLPLVLYTIPLMRDGREAEAWYSLLLGLVWFGICSSGGGVFYLYRWRIERGTDIEASEFSRIIGEGLLALGLTLYSIALGIRVGFSYFAVMLVAVTFVGLWVVGGVLRAILKAKAEGPQGPMQVRKNSP